MYEDQLKQFRARSIEKSLRAGVPAYILDEIRGEGVIRIRVDGGKERIVIVRGKAVVVTFDAHADCGEPHSWR